MRRLEVPVVHTDFTSQYPTVNALLGNWRVLTAERVSFEDATEEVRAFLSAVTLDDLFRKEVWAQLSFFALVEPADDKRYDLALEQDARSSKIIPQTYGYVLRLYPFHAESKSLSPDGSPCSARTRGLLQRTSITAGQRHFVGKETDRRWEYGEELSLLQFKVMEYRPSGRMTVADRALRKRVASAGVRSLMRNTGLSQHTLEAVRHGRKVRHTTLQRLMTALS